MLRSPDFHEPLIYKNKNKTAEFLIGKHSGKSYPVTMGVPILIDQGKISDTTRCHLSFYEKIAPLYDKLHMLQAVSSGGEGKIRGNFLKRLGIKENDKVLEVSVGTGANIRLLPRHAHYYGIDISWQMLRQCLQTKDRYEIDVELFLGDAEKLPFRDNVFDVVFTVCAFRLLNDKQKALNEMVRVTKPGSKIVIVDQQKAGPPIELVPHNISDVKTEEIDAWKLYYMSFTKPLS